MIIIDAIKNNIPELISSFFGAFFAFIFFIIGQKWSDYRKEKKDIVLYLDKLKRVFAFQTIPLEVNISFANSIINSKNPISINIGKYEYLMKSDDIYIEKIKYKVLKIIVYLISFSDVVNNNIKILNSNMDLLSSLSKDIMINNKYSEFKLTMEENFLEIRKRSETILKDFLYLKNDLLLSAIDEIDFTLWYLNKNYIQRKFVDLVVKINPKYREEKINKLRYQKENIKDENESRK